MLHHYVAFLFPNDPEKIEDLFKIKIQLQEIVDRHSVMDNLPANAYAFYFFDRYEEVINGKYLLGKPINHSAPLFIGPVYTFSEIEDQFPEVKYILKNKLFGLTQAIRTCYNGWILLPNDALII